MDKRCVLSRMVIDFTWLWPIRWCVNYRLCQSLKWEVGSRTTFPTSASKKHEPRMHFPLHTCSHKHTTLVIRVEFNFTTVIDFFHLLFIKLCVNVACVKWEVPTFLEHFLRSVTLVRNMDLECTSHLTWAPSRTWPNWEPIMFVDWVGLWPIGWCLSDFCMRNIDKTHFGALESLVNI